jgi:hypothetical protein
VDAIIPEYVKLDKAALDVLNMPRSVRQFHLGLKSTINIDIDLLDTDADLERVLHDRVRDVLAGEVDAAWAVGWLAGIIEIYRRRKAEGQA